MAPVSKNPIEPLVEPSSAELERQALRVLIDQLPAVLWATDTKLRFTYSLGAHWALRHLNLNQVVGTTLSDYFQTSDPQFSVIASTRQALQGESVSFETTWMGRTLQFYVEPLRCADGTIAGTIGVALDTTQRKLAEERTNRLLKQVITAQEEERRRIARELHDATGQSLTSLLVGLRTLEDVDTVANMRQHAGQLRMVAAETFDEVRRLARGLRPSLLDDLGLVPALERHAEEYAQSHGIAVDVHCSGLELLRLSPAVETTVFRIVQEALTNVLKHAAAQSVSILLDGQPSSLQVIIEDDGCGFDADAVLRKIDGSKRIGLESMRERAQLLNGSLSVESSPGQGTAVCVRIPLLDDSTVPKTGDNTSS